MCGCNKFKQKGPAPTPPQRPLQGRPAATPHVVTAPLATVDTSVWGANLWKVLHIAAHSSRSKTIIPLWRTLLAALLYGLPCPDCSAHYNAWYKSHPLHTPVMLLGGSINVSKWVLDLHNNVNQRTGRPVWTLEQAATAYTGRINDARTTAASLNGIIGSQAYSALNALLKAL